MLSKYREFSKIIKKKSILKNLGKQDYLIKIKFT